MEIFSINKEIINVNRIEELEEKIDRLIEGYRLMKQENEQLKTQIQEIQNNDKDLEVKITEIRGERELLIEKVQKILEKVENVEI
ncbi:MAG: cell division protein ZapB [Syntrophorhabdaceae bacterium]